MPATYDDDELTPKDRVRGMLGGVASAGFSDGRILAALTRLGDPAPFDENHGDPVRETRAAIELARSAPVTTGRTDSFRQGSVAFSGKDDALDYSVIAASLQARLNDLLSAIHGDGSGIAVAQCRFPDLEPCGGYPYLGDG